MKRTTTNTILIVTGSLTVLTALFLLFHYESHFTKLVHQVGGLIFVIFCIHHMRANSAIKKNITDKKVKLLISSMIIASAIIMITTGAMLR